MQIIKGSVRTRVVVPEGVTAKLHRLTTNLNPSGVSKVPVTGQGMGLQTQGDLRNTCTTWIFLQWGRWSDWTTWWVHIPDTEVGCLWQPEHFKKISFKVEIQLSELTSAPSISYLATAFTPPSSKESEPGGSTGSGNNFPRRLYRDAERCLPGKVSCFPKAVSPSSL